MERITDSISNGVLQALYSCPSVDMDEVKTAFNFYAEAAKSEMTAGVDACYLAYTLADPEAIAATLEHRADRRELANRNLNQLLRDLMYAGLDYMPESCRDYIRYINELVWRCQDWRMQEGDRMENILQSLGYTVTFDGRLDMSSLPGYYDRADRASCFAQRIGA
jgi:hypothetical protein